MAVSIFAVAFRAAFLALSAPAFVLIEVISIAPFQLVMIEPTVVALR